MLALTLAVAAGYMAWQIATESIQERFVNQLIEVGKISSDGLVRQEDQMLETLRLISNTKGLTQAILEKDPSTLRSLILPIAANAQEEAVIVLNLKGVAIMSMYHRPGGLIEEYTYTQGDETMQSWQIVLDIINNKNDPNGNKFPGIYDTPLGPYFFISGPVFEDNNKLGGVILVGRSANQIVSNLRKETLAQITLYDQQGRVLATTFLQDPQLSASISSGVIEKHSTSSLIRSLSSSEIEYNEVLGVWKARQENIGVIGASFPQNFIVRMGNTTWIRIFTIILISILITIAVGSFLSNLISIPIRKLEKAASRIANGDLAIQIEATGNDEVTRLTQEFNTMARQLQQSKTEIMNAYESTIEGWARTLELRDRETFEHSLNVVDLTLRVAKKFGFRKEELVNIRRGAFLHDIGKLAIPDEILLKKEPLTVEELSIVRDHPQIAYDVLININFLKDAIDIPYCHHEYWDGSGYPRGLKGEEIPLAARIFTVVDVWDAVRSKRPYHNARTREEAEKIIREGIGNLFDPNVAAVFLETIRGKLG